MKIEVLRFVEASVDINKVLDPVIDFGGLLAEEQQKEFGSAIRNIFPGKEYRIFDARPGSDIVGDILNIQLAPGTVGTALLLETLEHLAEPQKAINELYRVLKPGGLLIVTTLMCWEEHRCPKDYWRFLPDGIEHLLTQAHFIEAKIIKDGKASEPSGVFATGRKPINAS